MSDQSGGDWQEYDQPSPRKTIKHGPTLREAMVICLEKVLHVIIALTHAALLIRFECPRLNSELPFQLLLKWFLRFLNCCVLRINGDEGHRNVAGSHLGGWSRDMSSLRRLVRCKEVGTQVLYTWRHQNSW